MMWSDELHAAWDGPSGAVVLHHAEPSRLQTLALEYAKKVGRGAALHSNDGGFANFWPRVLLAVSLCIHRFPAS